MPDLFFPFFVISIQCYTMYTVNRFYLSVCTFLYPFMGSLVDTEVRSYYSTELKIDVKFQIFVLCMHGVVECEIG